MPKRLTLERIVRREKLPSAIDRRRKINVVIASYRDSAGDEYRKSFESYFEPHVPNQGTHETLNRQQRQWEK